MRLTGFLFLTATAITACGPGHIDNGATGSIGDAGFNSLSNSDYKGKKFYLGWGAAMSDDPSEMQNEVKYDVLHTQEIFTQKWGGNYSGQQLIASQVTGSAVHQKWNDMNAQLHPEDMYVQYSSGHGYEGGLAVGLTYDDIIDQLMKMKNKEVIVFVMACYSGGLVDRLNERKSEWADWEKQGRTLFVLASSPASQESSTGPGTDSDEPTGPDGSAGSAFGYSLWKALIGYADGSVDGVKDGYVSLGEILAYTTQKTLAVGGHKPVYTGTFNPNLIMNRVPPKAYVASLTHTTEGMSDDQVRQLVKEYDSEQQ